MGDKRVACTDGTLTKVIEELRLVLGADSNSDVIKEAIILLEVFVRLIAQGKNLYAGETLSEAETVHIPSLQRVKLIRTENTKPTRRIKRPVTQIPTTGDKEPFREE